jgi:hypothetical protein
MLNPIRAKVGFVSSGAPSSPHYGSFKAFIPREVEVEFEGLGLLGESLYDLKGKKESYVSGITDLVKSRRWQGVMVSGAPGEVLNPGLLNDLRSSLAVPVVTALASSIAALRAYSAARVVLMTPFDEPLNRLIRAYLAVASVEALSPSDTLRHYTEGPKLGPEEVHAMTKKALSEHPDVHAIYFQGAVLDPLKILQQIETELKLPIVASNPAMLWYILSKLGLKYSIAGYGKLLSEWPMLKV